MARSRARKYTKKSQRGFTLVEVVIAILVLAGSLVVLLGLQSASVTKALRDRNQLQAMLAARHVFAAVEVFQEFNDRDDTLPVYQLLKDLGALPDIGDSAEEEELYSGMEANIQISEWENPEALAPLGADINLLKRIYLKILWGESPDDQLEIVYFIANENNSPLS